MAILSRQSPEEVNRGLPGDDDDEQARFIEAVFSVDGGVVRVASLYLPNGNPVLAGDYNVIPEPVDCHDPRVWEGDALFRPESRAAFRRLENLGFTDALRAVNDQPETYTFWDYQAGAWPKNNGIRIDHLMLSPEAANRLQSANVEKHVRGWERPSDHVPGKRIKEGGVVCLQIGSSQRYLARCERNLNNTSWKKISDGCPTAQLSPWATRSSAQIPG